MRDLLFLVLTLGFFGATSLLVAGCDRIVGPDPSPRPDGSSVDGVTSAAGS